MKRKYIFLSTSGLLALFAISFFASNQNISDKDERSVDKADSLIRVEKPNDKTILVQLGYDAVTAVNLLNGIIVFDAGISNELTTKYRKIIENEFQPKKIAYLINTHYHPDHYGGNNIFSDIKIIAHENYLQEISVQRKDQNKVKSNLLQIVDGYNKELQTLKPNSKEWMEAFLQKTRYEFAYNDALKNYPLINPSITFADSLKIDMGDAGLDLTYFGNAHSNSDILIHIPELKLLMVGDLFSKYGRPGFDCDNLQNIDRLLKSIEWLKTRLSKIEYVISGHGQILKKEDLESFIKNVEK